MMVGPTSHINSLPVSELIIYDKACVIIVKITCVKYGFLRCIRINWNEMKTVIDDKTVSVHVTFQATTTL